MVAKLRAGAVGPVRRVEAVLDCELGQEQAVRLRVPFLFFQDSSVTGKSDRVGAGWRSHPDLHLLGYTASGRVHKVARIGGELRHRRENCRTDRRECRRPTKQGCLP